MPEGRKYCSLECYRSSPRPNRKNGKDVTCRNCSQVFYRPKSQADKKNQFCSVECHNLWQGRNKTTHVCKICGGSFQWSPSRSLQNKITYCSLECRDKDADRKEMLLELNHRQQTMKCSSIEKIGYELLDSLDIEYQAQHMIANKFCVDAFVPSHNLVIQFDGDYWHGNPEKFSNLDERQRRRVKLDLSQDRYMEVLGYKVLRLWGSSLRKNRDAIQVLLHRLLILESHNLFPTDSNRLVA